MLYGTHRTRTLKVLLLRASFCYHGDGWRCYGEPCVRAWHPSNEGFSTSDRR